MSDFNWDDFEGNDDELFGRNDDENNEDDRTQHLQKLHRLMFIDDIEKFPSQKIPLDPIEAEDLFGKLTNEDNRILTKLLMRDYFRNTIDDIIFRWGLDWIDYLIKYNEKREEYEVCATFKEIKDSAYGSPITTEMIERYLNET